MEDEEAERDTLDLINIITKEYMKLIELEKSKRNRKLQVLEQKKKQIEKEFEDYRAQIEIDLDESVKLQQNTQSLISFEINLCFTQNTIKTYTLKKKMLFCKQIKTRLLEATTKRDKVSQTKKFGKSYETEGEAKRKIWKDKISDLAIEITTFKESDTGTMYNLFFLCFHCKNFKKTSHNVCNILQYLCFFFKRLPQIKSFILN